MYSTVVTSHPTSVIHPSVPIGSPTIMTNAAGADMFAGEKRLAPGSFSVPTKLMELNYGNDRNFLNLEKPIFLHKGQTSKEIDFNGPPPPLTGVKLGNVVQKAANEGKDKLF